MADFALSTQGSVGGDALLRIRQALDGLAGCLETTAEELGDVGNMLKVEIAAEIVNGSADAPQTSRSGEARPQLLLVVAGTLKEMVETLVSDIRSNADVQELLPAIRNSFPRGNDDAPDDIPKISEHPPDDFPFDSVETALPSAQVPASKDLRLAKRAKRVAEKGQRICKHWCKNHPELVDPNIWRKLPHELVPLILAKLPFPRIIELYKSSMTWTALSNLPNFRATCAEEHPKLFGIVGSHAIMGSVCINMHDMKSCEWIDYPDIPGTAESPWGDDYMYSCDGGLACFAPLKQFHFCPILIICNPLTGIAKDLPLLNLEDIANKELRLVQLVKESDQDCYRVIIVIEDEIRKVFSAYVYNSNAGVWSTLDSGLVHGDGLTDDDFTPFIFDCSTKQLFELRRCASLGRLNRPSAYATVRDRLFVLHETTVCDVDRGVHMYLVSEYTWESSISDLRALNIYETPLRVWGDSYTAMLFASPSFFLVVAENREDWDQEHHQVIGRYDVSANQWAEVPRPVCDGETLHFDQLMNVFMCELRWDVNP